MTFPSLLLAFFQLARNDRCTSVKAGTACAKGPGESREAPSYFTSDKIRDPVSPRVRFDWLNRKLRLAARWNRP